MKLTKKKFAKIIDRAIELLNRPNGWTKSTEARDKTGASCAFDSPRACSHCVAGAIALADLEITGSRNDIFLSPTVTRAAEAMGFDDELIMTGYNDQKKTKAPVLRKLRALRTSLAVLLLFVGVLGMTGCTTVNPGVGYEAVLVQKPMIFGHGGVDPDPIHTGLTFAAFTTQDIYVNVQPVQYELKANDFMSSDGVPLDFDAVVRLKVNDSVGIIRGFGENWYQVNVEREFSNLLRQEVRQHTMNETAISTTAIDSIDSKVGDGLKAYLAKAQMPVTLVDVTVGRAMPPDAIRHQRIETAQQEQRVLTEGQRKLAEDSRKAAEFSRAEADNAYRNAMSLSPDQFLQLEKIKMQDHVCGQGHTNCTFIVGGAATPILDTRK